MNGIGATLRHFAATLAMAMTGQHGLAFLSAALLGGYWFGGEGLLLVIGLTIPAGIALMGMLRDNLPLTGRDGQTGLPRRSQALRRLNERLTRAPATGHATACFVIEIDEFSDHLARLGEQAMNEVIIRTAERLVAVVRDSDMIARLDGACFAMIPGTLRRADLPTAIQISARLAETVSEPLSINSGRLHVTASVGFALPQQVKPATAASVMDAAECALADARSQGPGSIRAYAAGHKRQRPNRHELAEQAAAALDSGQIMPWFQPQLSTDTGAVVGVEALVRWHHPEHGILAPAEFMGAIEQIGQGRRLGEVMLYHSLAALKAWDADGITVPSVSVNLSSDDLRNPRLPDSIRWELDRFDLPPGRLTVKVLETVVAGAGDDVILRNLGALSEMGVAIDLDDFGIGATSIGAIRQFGIDRIKIDRSFVTRLDRDRAQQDLTSAILSMADRLGVATVAEGVETLGEHAMLAQLGCGAVQGMGIAPPMTQSDLAPWMQRHLAKLSETPRVTSRKLG